VAAGQPASGAILTARRFKAGSVLLAEDMWGTGHSSRVIGDVECLGLVFDLPEPA